MAFAPADEWVRFSSSVLAAGMWTGQGEVLLLRFNHGQVYPYGRVPYEVWDGLVNAPSQGVYYNAHIKGRYSA